jgi:hypothetical protein
MRHVYAHLSTRLSGTQPPAQMRHVYAHTNTNTNINIAPSTRQSEGTHGAIKIKIDLRRHSVSTINSACGLSAAVTPQSTHTYHAPRTCTRTRIHTHPHALVRDSASQGRLHDSPIVFKGESVSVHVPVIWVFQRAPIARSSHRGAWSPTPYSADTPDSVDVARGVRGLWELAVWVSIARAEDGVVQCVPVRETVYVSESRV